MADGDGVGEGLVVTFGLADRFEVDGDTEGGADFVLTTVAAADGSGFVVENVHEGLQESLHFPGLGDELGLVLQEGKDGGLDGRDVWVEAHHGADVGLAAFLGEVFFVVGFANEGEDGAVATGGGLDDVGKEFLLRLLVEILEGLLPILVNGVSVIVFSGQGFGVGAEVVVAAVGDAFEFLLAEGEVVFDVVSLLRIVGAFAVRDVEDVELVGIESDLGIELEALGEPFLGEAQAVFGAAEVFHFHLFEFTGAKGEVARIDFVAERLSDLGDAEGKFDAVGVHHVLVLHEDGLSGFGTEIGGGVRIVFVGRGAHLRFEHQFEVTRFGEFAGLVLSFWELGLFLAGGRAIKCVCPIAFLADLAVDHGIGESADVTGGGEDGVVG